MNYLVRLAHSGFSGTLKTFSMMFACKPPNNFPTSIYNFFLFTFFQIGTTQSKLCLHKFGRAFLHIIKDDFYNEGALPNIGKGVEKKVEEKVGEIQLTLTNSNYVRRIIDLHV